MTLKTKIKKCQLKSEAIIEGAKFLLKILTQIFE